MSTEIPATVNADTVTSWSDEVDVVVIGFGIGGGCAAVSAAAAGARVLVLERAAAAGGTTSLAGGHFYLGGGTAVQQATGNPDSPEEMYKYLVAVSRQPDEANRTKIRAYCDGSVEHFNWLEDLGFQFERSFFPGKAVIQPNTEGLMYTGNEKVWPFLEMAVPAPRGHKVPVPGDTGGASMVIDLLLKRAASLGVQVRYETGATELIVDGSAGSGPGSRVTGVMWKRFSESGAIKAKSVIIAAGGFVMNPAMVAKYTPKLAEKPFVLGNTYDDGLGIRMGVSAGGATQHMDQIFITAPPYPPSILLTGIIVNKLGQRFVAEDSYHSRTSGFIMDQPDSAAFLIVDEAHLEHPKMPLVPLIDGWETVAEMEAALGIPRGNLAATLDRYNGYAARGEDPDFHKQPEFLAPQDNGPWGAFDMSLGKAMYAGFTVGGLATSVDGEVLRDDGSVVGGLYAVGACASNIAQDGKGYASGTQLGEGSFFGRRAGTHAAAAAHAR
ncbi:Fumarate reductase flavoprotein subunit [Mycobacterium simulans]|uniref:Fumarate reductase flavoprotein subunit n=1 Tax=Mycobacterium simulans TaxID=627089 RepID=A0A7Z7IMW6_9MYCO|nr:FAD-binding protein [Mycobacterium simulans]SOJ55382.1 Fumarate reductase flavoprotein subunit [Mycobacterium simulans]